MEKTELIICRLCKGGGGLKGHCSACGGSGWLHAPAIPRVPSPRVPGPLESNVQAFANELNKSVENLLEQLEQAGAPKVDTTDAVSISDKKLLLDYLIRSSR